MLNPPTADVEMLDPSEIKDEGVMEPPTTVSEGSEEMLESEGSKPPGEHLKPPFLTGRMMTRRRLLRMMQPSGRIQRIRRRSPTLP